MKVILSLLLLCLFSASCAPKRIQTGKVIGPYAPAIKAGKTLYISGQIALKPGTTDLVNTNFETEVVQVLENLVALLRTAGYKTSDLVQCTIYLKDINDYAEVNRIYGSYFEKGRTPTRTTIAVSNLPRNARIEISAIAYK